MRVLGFVEGSDDLCMELGTKFGLRIWVAFGRGRMIP